jgi:hypothetical protein
MQLDLFGIAVKAVALLILMTGIFAAAYTSYKSIKFDWKKEE